MKTKYITSIIFIIGGLIFTSCDKVEMPIEKPEVIVPEGADSVDFPVVDSANINRAFRKTLVEEVTGHLCIACPPHSRKLLEQQKNNKDRMIVIAVHADFFARLDPIKKFTRDFKTTYGDALFSHFNFSGEAIPAAMINRKVYPMFDDTRIFNNSIAWKEPIDEENTNTSTPFGLGLAADYNDSLQLFYIQTSIEALEDISVADGQSYSLLLVCVEDSIIAPQLDDEADVEEYPGKKVTDFVHRHALVGKLSTSQSISGDVIIDEPISAGEWIDYQLNAKMPEKVEDPHHTSIVAMIINTQTEEVIQSEEVHVHIY